MEQPQAGLPIAGPDDPCTIDLGQMTLRLYGSRILIHLPDEDGDARETEGGVLVPKFAESEEELQVATILAVGQGRYNNEKGIFHGCDFKPGDRIWGMFRDPEGNVLYKFVDKVPGHPQIYFAQEHLIRAVVSGVVSTGEKPHYYDPQEPSRYD